MEIEKVWANHAFTGEVAMEIVEPCFGGKRMQTTQNFRGNKCM